MLEEVPSGALFAEYVGGIDGEALAAFENAAVLRRQDGDAHGRGIDPDVAATVVGEGDLGAFDLPLSRATL
jgi:hypothetical protein